MESGEDRPPLQDRRVRRSRAVLQSALIDLVEERGDLVHVSVADVTARAEVSRSTFYDHFADVHELAEAACAAMLDELIDSLPEPGSVPHSDAAAVEALTSFFAGFGEHARLYAIFLGPRGSARILDNFRNRIIGEIARGAEQRDGRVATARPKLTAPPDVSAAFGAGALMSVAIDWLQHDRPTSPHDLAQAVFPLFDALYR